MKREPEEETDELIEEETFEEETFDPALLDQQKYCPKCYTDDLDEVDHGWGDDAYTFECRSCHGIWAMNLTNVRVEASEGVEPPAHDRDSDLRAGICPFAHGILRRAQTHLPERFYLERCGACSGIWFDRGEWERAAAAGLMEDIHQIWTESWQSRKLDEERQRSILAQAREALGDEMVDELREVGRKLRDRENRNQGIGLLLEVIRGNLD